MDPREELQALRRLAELEAKASGSPAKPAFPSDADMQRERRQDVANQFGGLVRGAGSIGATLMAPIDYVARKLNDGKPVDVFGAPVLGVQTRRADIDAALQGLIGADPKSGWYQSAKLASELAGTAGVGGLLAKGAQGVGAAPSLVSALQTGGFTTGAAPATVGARAADLALRTGAGAVAGGASAGLVNPESAATGAKVGAALPAGAKVAGAIGGAIGNAIRPNVNNAALAQKAVQQYGIPLGAADISASPLTKGLRSVLNDAPITGGIGSKQREAVQAGFNRAVGETFGAPAPKLTPAVMDTAKQRMGAEFDRIWNQNTLQVDAPLFQQLQTLRANADKLPQGEASRLNAWLDDIQNKLVPGANGAPTLPGDVANRLQSKLRQEAEKASGFLKADLIEARKALIAAFNRSVSPQDAAALSKNMGQYKAFKTVQPLLDSAEAGVAGREAGDIPAALLPQAVRQSYRGGIASSPFADLSQIGSQYVADRVARTGGSARALIQNSAIGSALGMGAMTNPLLALGVIPTAAVAQKALGSPRVANALLSANPNALALSPELQALMFRTAPVLASDQ